MPVLGLIADPEITGNKFWIDKKQESSVTSASHEYFSFGEAKKFDLVYSEADKLILCLLCILKWFSH